MKKIIGWSEAPLMAEKKLDNLFYTVGTALDALKRSYEISNPLKDSTFEGLTFTGSRGYCVHMRFGRGHWFAWGHEVTSGGDERERVEYPLWNRIQSPYDYAKGISDAPRRRRTWRHVLGRR